MHETLIKDLEYATEIAKRADNAPLIGGPIGLMWTGLATVALMAHGAILARWVDVPVSMSGLVWAVYGLVGTALTILMARRLVGMPGHRTFANRVADACWFAVGIAITIVAITTVVAFMSGEVGMSAFNFIVPTAFALSAVAYTVLARLTRHGYLRFAAAASLASTSITLFIVNEPAMYFVAGVLLIISGVVPSLIEIRKAAA